MPKQHNPESTVAECKDSLFVRLRMVNAKIERALANGKQPRDQQLATLEQSRLAIIANLAGVRDLLAAANLIEEE